MTAITRTSSRPAPAAGRSGASSNARGRVRSQWLVLAVALLILAGTLVAWALTRAGARVPVVSVARPVPAGAVITFDDLTTSAIAFDTAPHGLVPAASLSDLVGRVATIELVPGTLLSVGMWADSTALSPDERTVGALLQPGRFPAGLTAGMTAAAIVVGSAAAEAFDRAASADRGTGTGTGTADTTGTLDTSGPTDTVGTLDTAGTTGSAGTTDTTGETGAAGELETTSTGGRTSMLVRVVDATTTDTGALRITLAAAVGDATVIARLAAIDSLALVGVPSTPTTSAAPQPPAASPRTPAPSATTPAGTPTTPVAPSAAAPVPTAAPAPSPAATLPTSGPNAGPTSGPTSGPNAGGAGPGAGPISGPNAGEAGPGAEPRLRIFGVGIDVRAALGDSR